MANEELVQMTGALMCAVIEYKQHVLHNQTIDCINGKHRDPGNQAIFAELQ